MIDLTKNNSFITATLSQDYIVPYQEHEVGKCIEDWFHKFPAAQRHVSRESYQVGASEKFLSVRHVPWSEQQKLVALKKKLGYDNPIIKQLLVLQSVQEQLQGIKGQQLHDDFEANLAIAMDMVWMNINHLINKAQK